MSNVNQYYVRHGTSPAVADRVHLSMDRIPPDLAQAYALVLDATRHDRRFGAAWKLGGTTPATRRAFKVDKVYFGAEHQDEILVEPDIVHAGDLCEIKGEAEIALRLGSAVEGMTAEEFAHQRAADIPERKDLFDGWCVALEMPSSPILNLAQAGVNALITDRCAAGRLLLGATRSVKDTAWRRKHTLSIEADDKTVSEGDIGSLVAPPDDCAIDFAYEAVRHRFTLMPGQWVSTGGLSPCVPLHIGSRVRVLFGGHAALDFKLQA